VASAAKRFIERSQVAKNKKNFFCFQRGEDVKIFSWDEYWHKQGLLAQLTDSSSGVEWQKLKKSFFCFKREEDVKIFSWDEY
jgi:hypothetical protein